jgi:adenosylhomocysteinase
MDGYRVMKLIDAAREADLILSVTGNKHVVDAEHMKVAKNGVILAQSGHFDVEINKDALKKMAKSVRQVRPFVQEYNTGKKLFYLLGEGRLINLAAAEGHPASVMDMSFAGQAMAALYMWENKGKLAPSVHQLPHKLDAEIARLKLKAEGVSIDSLTPEQKAYLESWQEGTSQ